jgi:hypothetical protein
VAKEVVCGASDATSAVADTAVMASASAGMHAEQQQAAAGGLADISRRTSNRSCCRPCARHGWEADRRADEESD